MTEKQARYFMEVYRKRNIASAAGVLFVSRPVISRAIADLESEFGAEMFLRSAAGVEPTDAGIKLHRLISEMTANYNYTASDIKNTRSSNGASRAIRIGLSPTNSFAAYYALLRGFLRAYTDVRFSIIEYPARDLADYLINGELDVVFSPMDISDANLGLIDIFQARFSLGVSLKSPLAGKKSVSIIEILDLTFATMCAPMPLEEVFNSYFSAYNKKPNIAVRSTNLDMLKTMAQDGIVAVVLPDSMMSGWEGVSIVALDFFRASTHRLVWNKRFTNNSAVEELISFVSRQEADYYWRDSVL